MRHRLYVVRCGQLCERIIEHDVRIPSKVWQPFGFRSRLPITDSIQQK